MYYSEEVLTNVRQANDIVDVISEYVTLEKKGSTYFGLCPFHSEKTPSFSVDPRDQFFYCFGCHTGGNVITFIMKMENMTFPEAVRFLADRAHIDLPEEELTPTQKKMALERSRLYEAARLSARFYYSAFTRTKGGAIAQEYLKKRQVSEKFRRKFGLGYSPVSRTEGLTAFLKSKGYTDAELLKAGLVSGKEGAVYDRFFNRLMFPIFDTQGRVIAFGGRVMGEGEPKYLNSSDNALFNKRRNLYALSIAKRTRRDFLILVEGYMDVISLHQAGYDNAVASLGTALTQEQCTLMKRYFDKVYVCYDSDMPGTNAARRAIPLLENAGITVKVMQVPGSKDPDEYIKENGSEAFEKVIDTAADPVLFEMMVLERLNGSGVEGQIETVHAMASRLAQIQDDLDRSLHIRDMASRMKISEKDLAREVDTIRQTDGLLEYRSARRQHQMENAKVYRRENDARGQLLAALLKEPSLYPYVRPYLSEEDFPESDPYTRTLSQYVISHLEAGRPAALSDAVNLFETPEDQERLSSLYEFSLPEDLLDQEKFLTQTVRSVKQQYLTEAADSSDEEVLLHAVKVKQELAHLSIHIGQPDGKASPLS